MKSRASESICFCTTSDRRGETPQREQNSAHEADNHAEQSRGATQNPLWQFVAAGAVDKTDRQGEREDIPDRVAMLCQHLAQPFGGSVTSDTAVTAAGVGSADGSAAPRAATLACDDPSDVASVSGSESGSSP